MKRRFALYGLSLLPAFLAQDLAQAEQIFAPASRTENFVSCRIGCTHFEGYVVVKHADVGEPAIVRPDASLNASRLYLPTEDVKTR